MIKDKFSVDEYVFATLNIYLDIINLFLLILHRAAVALSGRVLNECLAFENRMHCTYVRPADVVDV